MTGRRSARSRSARAASGSAADGAVGCAQADPDSTHEGKTVIARLALRLDESLAGQTLTAEVEATEAGGRRQLERDAGTVRVAR